MPELTVQNIGTDRNASLVVDSRLIAEVLGVNHGAWMTNIVKKYQAEIEQDFGKVRFENGTVVNSVGAVNTTIYALLTEDQATCLMTYSKNTDQVRAAKRNLVKSFSKAKELLMAGSRVDPEPLKLAPPIERIASLRSSLEFFDIDVANPRFKQALQDLTLDVLGVSGPAIKGDGEVWCGVAERAEQLGYSAAWVLNNRSQMGKFVKRLVPECDRRQEERLCNGIQRKINLYRVSESLDSAIYEYFLEGSAVAS